MWERRGGSGSDGVTGPRCRRYVGAVPHAWTRLTNSKKILQGEFSEGTLADVGTRGLWDDISANLARLMAIGPPAEELMISREVEGSDVEEVRPQAQEKVRATAALTLELTLAYRNRVISAGRRRSPV